MTLISRMITSQVSIKCLAALKASDVRRPSADNDLFCRAIASDRPPELHQPTRTGASANAPDGVSAGPSPLTMPCSSRSSVMPACQPHLVAVFLFCFACLSRAWRIHYCIITMSCPVLCVSVSVPPSPSTRFGLSVSFVTLFLFTTRLDLVCTLEFLLHVVVSPSCPLHPVSSLPSHELVLIGLVV